MKKASAYVKYDGDPRTYFRKMQGKNYKSYCMERQQRTNGVFRCTFEKRESDLIKEINAGKLHQCKFVKEKQMMKSLNAYYAPKQVEPDDDNGISYDDILTKVAMLVGRRNLSLEAGASLEMQELIKLSIRYGMQNAKAKKVEDIFPKYTANTVRKFVIDTAIEVNKIQYQMFSSLAFTGVSIDEGTTKGIHDLDFVLESPLSGFKPYPCFTSIMKGGTATDYTEHLARGLDFLRINKIRVGSVTVDGNTAQLKALSFDWSDSLRRRYIDHDDFMRRILVNPCLCHRVNNAYKAACKDDILLERVVENLRRISNECRNNRDKLSAMCPKAQLSRWIVDYELCSFILNHVDQVGEIIQKDSFLKNEKDKFIRDLKLLHRILEILKSLVNIFEDPKTPHFKAFRIIEDAISVLKHLEKSNRYAESVRIQLERYCVQSKDAGIWMLSYILTPDGRADFSWRVNNGYHPPQPNWETAFSIKSKSTVIEDVEDIVDLSIDLSSEKLELPPEEVDYSTEYPNFLKDAQNKRGKPEKHYEVIPNDENEEDNQEQNGSEEEEEEEEANDAEEDEHEEEEEIRGLPYYPAQKYLETILKNWGINNKSREVVLSRFNTFIRARNDVLKMQGLENGDYYWEHIQKVDIVWSTLSEIAMRLHCSPCSEASCERTISMQRIVLTARRMCSKKDLLDARLTLIRGLNKEEEEEEEK